jgi:hypothetical protein
MRISKASLQGGNNINRAIAFLGGPKMAHMEFIVVFF